MSDLTALWESLQTTGEHRDGYVRLRVASIDACAAYAARRISTGAEALILEVATSAVPSSPAYPESAGFELRVEPIKPGRHGRTRFILLLTGARFQDVFRSLCDDVLQSLSTAGDEAETIRTFVSRLSRWQSFLRKHGPSGLSSEKRRGLFGELTFLRDLLGRLGSDEAVGAWKGSTGANHDFQFPMGSLEVKTTSANTPHSFRISNVGQLDDEGLSTLFLHSIVLEESEGATESLAELIDAIRLRLCGYSADLFEDSLVQSGYLEAHRDQYSSPRYSIRFRKFYRVSQGFPRLCVDDLPAGVEDVSYAVAIAACEKYECGDTQVFGTLIPKLLEHVNER